MSLLEKTKTKSPFCCSGVDVQTLVELAWSFPEKPSQAGCSRRGPGGSLMTWGTLGPRPPEERAPLALDAASTAEAWGRRRRVGRGQADHRPRGARASCEVGALVAHWPPCSHLTERSFLGVGGAQGGRKGNSNQTNAQTAPLGKGSRGPDGLSHLQPHPPARV